MARRKPGEAIHTALGLEPRHVKSKSVTPYNPSNGKNDNGHINGVHIVHPTRLEASVMLKALLYRYFQCAFFITFAAPFGFAALNHVSYPAMVLAKSCKLVPVLLMNIILYRRRFAPHKYLVVAMVTIGITMFMGFGSDKPRSTEKDVKGSSMIGIAYLLVNLAIDGATNSTQDEIFDKYSVTGQQMMFWINIMCTLITTVLSILPLPYIPVLHPSSGWKSEFSTSLGFINDHPGVISPLLQFALTGSLGQLFIFETLQHFGSLTLV